MTTTLERAQRLIKVGTGEPYGDGDVVTDVGVGISEPGYGDSETVWALGNWNPKRFRREGEPPLTLAESMPERLADALERQGVECLWLDEWMSCDHCYQLFRTQPDSYSWTMYGHISEYGALCGNCLEWDFLADEVVNNPQAAVLPTWGIDLEAEGFVRLNPDAYQSGWHPGQTDDPRAIFASLEDQYGAIVFEVGSVGQFDVRFHVWVSDPMTDEAEDWAEEE